MMGKQVFQAIKHVLIACICVLVPVAVVRFLLIPGLALSIELSDDLVSIVRKLALVLTMTFGYRFYVKRFEHRPVSELSFELLKIVSAGSLGALCLSLPILFLFLKGDYTLIEIRNWEYSLEIAFVILSVAFLEEVVFRAILFGILARFLGLITALLVPSIIFSLAHFFNENWSSWIGVFSVILLGIMWSLVYYITNNLWAATLNHACWNFVIFLSGLPLTGEPEWRAMAPFETEITGTVIWTGGEGGPENSIAVIFVISIAVIVLSIKARKQQIKGDST